MCRYELSSDRTVAGGFVTRISHNGGLLPWQTAHHFLKTFYMPMLLRPRGFLQGLRCLLGALQPNPLPPSSSSGRPAPTMTACRVVSAAVSLLPHIISWQHVLYSLHSIFPGNPYALLCLL